MFGMGERNACSRTQGGICGYFDRCWGITALSRLDCAWEANVSWPECRVREQVPCPCSSLKAWIQATSYNFCRRAISNSLWNTFFLQIHLSFHCILQIHLQISVVVEMKKQASSLDVMNFRSVKKGGCGLCLWDFCSLPQGSVYKGWFPYALLFQIPSYRPNYILTIWEKLF